MGFLVYQFERLSSLSLEERDGRAGEEEDAGASETPHGEVGHEPGGERRGEAEDGTAGLEDLNTGPVRE